MTNRNTHDTLIKKRENHVSLFIKNRKEYEHMSQIEMVQFYENKLKQNESISEREWHEYESALYYLKQD